MLLNKIKALIGPKPTTALQRLHVTSPRHYPMKEQQSRLPPTAWYTSQGAVFFTTTPETPETWESKLSRGIKIEDISPFALFTVAAQLVLAVWWSLQDSFPLTATPMASDLTLYLVEHPSVLLLAPAAILLFFEMSFFKKTTSFFPMGSKAGKAASVITSLLRMLAFSLVGGYALGGLAALWFLGVHYLRWSFFKRFDWTNQDVVYEGRGLLLKRKLDTDDVLDFLHLHAKNFGGRKNDLVEAADKYLEEHLEELNGAYFNSLQEGQARASQLMQELKQASPSIAKDAAAFVENLLKKDAPNALAEGKKLLEGAISSKGGVTPPAVNSKLYDLAAACASKGWAFVLANPLEIAAGVCFLGACAVVGMTWVVNYNSLQIEPTLVTMSDNLLALNAGLETTNGVVSASYTELKGLLDTMRADVIRLESTLGVNKDQYDAQIQWIKGRIEDLLARTTKLESEGKEQYSWINSRVDTLAQDQENINTQVAGHLNKNQAMWVSHQLLFGLTTPGPKTTQEQVDAIFANQGIPNEPKLQFAQLARPSVRQQQHDGASSSPASALTAMRQLTSVSAGNPDTVVVSGGLVPGGVRLNFTCNDVSATTIIKKLSEIFDPK